MQAIAEDSTQWDDIPVRVIEDMHRLTGACVIIEDGAVKGFFYEGKTEGEIKNG